MGKRHTITVIPPSRSRANPDREGAMPSAGFMSRIILSMVALLLTYPAAQAGRIAHTLSIDCNAISIDTVTHSSGAEYVKIEVPDLQNDAEENEPYLPVRWLTFEVPMYVNNFKVNILTYTPDSILSLERPLLPAEKLPTSLASGKGKAPVPAPMTTESPFIPSASVSHDYLVDGTRHFVRIKVSPFAYDRNAGRVYCYDNIGLELSYTECTPEELNFVPFTEGEAKPIHKVNESAIVREETGMSKVMRAADISALDTYIILAPENLAEAFDRFAEWKRQLGYKVVVRTFESIYDDPNFKTGSNDECFDNASSVREWLKAYLGSSRKAYCLIAGDYRTSAPIRKFAKTDSVLIDNKVHADSSKYIPSDNYFADLNTKWNLILTPAGIYSQSLSGRINGFSPTIPVGRLLCYTKEQINNFTDKVILYEQNPGRGDPSYLGNGLVVTHNDGLRYKKYNLFANLTNYSVLRMESNEANNINDLYPSGVEVIEAMKNKGLISLQVHGSPIGMHAATTSWEYTGWPKNKYIAALLDYKYSVNGFNTVWTGAVDELDNADKPSVVYSLACTIASFDNQYGDKEYPYSVASSFTTGKDYGGPVMLANTREGYWYYSNMLENNFGYAFNNSYSPVGLLENESKTYYSTYENEEWIKYAHNVIGDCSIKIWQRVPESMQVNCRIANNQLTVSNLNTNAGYWGIRSATGCRRGIISNIGNSMTVPLTELNNSNNTLVTFTIESNKYLPSTLIITNGQPIIGQKRCIVVNEGVFKDPSSLSSNNPGGSTVSTLEKYPSFLNIGNNSEINIFSYGDILSKKGVYVNNGGALRFESEKQVSMSHDIVAGGGSLEVTAKDLVLGSGFEVEPGGTFTFKNL